MSPTLILPGLNGSSNAHWQRIWARERPHSTVVEQADWACPVLSIWQRELDEALSQTGSAFLVAHSLGCLLAASYAERRIARRIQGALLVAPCALDATMELHPCLAGFGEEPLAALPFPSIVVGSLNDPYMRLDELERRAAIWGSELVVIGAAGHINVASGFGRWPDGYEVFDRLVRLSPALQMSIPTDADMFRHDIR